MKNSEMSALIKSRIDYYNDQLHALDPLGPQSDWDEWQIIGRILSELIKLYAQIPPWDD